ncbi:Hsp70 family protein [Erysipelothrix sp. D19-032]
MEIHKVVAQVLRDAEIKANQIDDIICVGGSSKSIIIQNYLENLLNKKIHIMTNPEEVVVNGLGLMIAIINREPGHSNTILTDVCPFSLGVDIVGDVYSPIISRNTTLPVSRSRYYVTTSNYQRKLAFSIYQGENLIASANNLLLSPKVPIIMKKEGEVGAKVTFTYDINGILDVEISGEDVQTEYYDRVITNKMISDKEVKRLVPFLKTIENMVATNREILLESRFTRLNMELGSENQATLRNLFTVFRNAQQEASKGKLIQVIKSIDSQLDDLEHVFLTLLSKVPRTTQISIREINHGREQYNLGNT